MPQAEAGVGEIRDAVDALDERAVGQAAIAFHHRDLVRRAPGPGADTVADEHGARGAGADVIDHSADDGTRTIGPVV